MSRARGCVQKRQRDYYDDWIAPSLELERERAMCATQSQLHNV